MTFEEKEEIVKRWFVKGMFVLTLLGIGYWLDVVPVACAKVTDIAQNGQSFRFADASSAKLPGHSSYSPDLKQLAYCFGEKEIFVRDIASGKVTTYPMQNNVHQLRYSPDGKYIAAGTELLNVNKGESIALATAAKLNSGLRNGLAFSADGSMLAIYSFYRKDNPSKNSVEIWNVADGSLRRSLPIQQYADDHYGMGGGVNDLAFSSDGKYLALAGNQILLWDVESGECVKQFASYRLPEDNALPRFSWSDYEALAFSPDGLHLAAAVCNTYSPQNNSASQGLQRSDVEVWNLESAEVLLLKEYGKENLERLCYSPDGKTLATGLAVGESKKVLELLDVQNGKVLQECKEYPDFSIVELGFSSEGKTVFAGGKYYMKTWLYK